MGGRPEGFRTGCGGTGGGAAEPEPAEEMDTLLLVASMPPPRPALLLREALCTRSSCSACARIASTSSTSLPLACRGAAGGPLKDGFGAVDVDACLDAEADAEATGKSSSPSAAKMASRSSSSILHNEEAPNRGVAEIWQIAVVSERL